jgi:CRISPR/Cas system-associated protein Cas7 (RAMP superfamily)
MVELQSVYELSLNLVVEWQAHSLSTIGSNGTNRVLPRRQLLSDQVEVDACSGNILKHQHAALVAPHFLAQQCPLCPACLKLDGRRAAALLDHPDYQPMTMPRILNACALCDAHGFLVTAKNAEMPKGREKKLQAERAEPSLEENAGEPGESRGAQEKENEARAKLHKESLLNFSYGLAFPDRQAETSQLHTRVGLNREEGQMLMKMVVRSGAYAVLVRYTCVGIGADTQKWELVVRDQSQRTKRHVAVLTALRDQLVSPSGAQTTTILPHLTGLRGVLVLRTGVGRAPCYSPLDPSFQERLTRMADPTCRVHLFDGVDSFYHLMQEMITTTVPAHHPAWMPYAPAQEDR